MKTTKKQLIQRIVLTVVLVGAGIWLWHDVIRDRVLPKRWGTVEQGAIYRSGQLSKSLIESTLEKNHIRTIISLTGEKPDDPDHIAEKAAADKLGIELLRFGLGGDGTGDIEHYAQAIAAIVKAKQEGKPVQVHCAAGTQRTGGVIACYRLLVLGDPKADVIREMRAYDWDPKDNPKLVPYINENMHTLATRLVALGVIESVPDPLPLL
ncbi:MAG: dual specificity protein phosphatase family protein [Phycisphaerae bacterium]|nr:dual specificity protein phosphatase family protein [Phycisphaerae bacterium]